MLSALCSGTLLRDPESRTSAAGKGYVTALLRVPNEGEDSVLVSLVAFSDTAVGALLALHKGDACAITGKAKLTSWTKDGEEKHGISVVAEQVLSLYALEKKRTKARGSADEPPRQTTGPIEEMASDVPF